MQGEGLRYRLVCRGFEANLARSVSLAYERVREPYSVVVLDWQTLELEFPGASRAEAWARLAREFRAAAQPTPGLVIIVESDQNLPPELAHTGAFFIPRSAANPETVAKAVERAVQNRADGPTTVESPGVVEDFLFGESEAIRQVFEQVRLVARRDTTVLITGETGTGKERVSRATHRLSSRRKMEMVSINCGGIPASLLEDEFFGHVKGAFTDARQARVGRFEQADRSTIFLDEIVATFQLELQPQNCYVCCRSAKFTALVASRQ